jgi:hypothetical protein
MQGRARRIDRFKINLETAAPRHPQRIFAQAPSPAKRFRCIDVGSGEEPRDVVFRDGTTLDAKRKPAERKPCQESATPGGWLAISPNKK